MGIYSDASFPIGVPKLTPSVVGIPEDVVRWRLRIRPQCFWSLFLKFKDGRMERWHVEFTDETNRAIKPKCCDGRNSTRVIYK